MGLRAASEVIVREVAGEVFIVPIRGRLADLQDLFVLNEVGHWVWERLDGSHTLPDLVAGVVAEFDVGEDQALSDVQKFLDQLTAAGLAQEVDAQQG